DSTHHSDTAHYHFSYSAAGTLNHTNSLESSVLTNAARISTVKKSAAVNLGGSWIYGKSSGILTNNDVTATLDFDLYKTFPHFYYWGLATYNTSISLLINHQLQTGLGAGYNIIDKKKAILNISDGLLYEKGDLYDSLYGGPNGNIFQRDKYQAVRNSLRLLYHWVIHDMYALDGAGFLQNSLANWSGDYIVKINLGASVKLYKWLSFSITYTYNQFTRTRSQTTLLNFGLTAQK
ncbi:MAG: DUF481 domain-containing protein, partial [Bacteroidota bacterium]